MYRDNTINPDKLREKVLYLKKDNYEELFPKTVELAATIKGILEKNHTMMGLSSTQIGSTLPIFGIKTENDYIELVINPIITEGEQMQIAPEGCASFPDMFCFVPRYRTIKVDYIGYDYKRARWRRKHHTLANSKAQIYQHEIDHLAGIIHFDRAVPITEKVHGRDLMIGQITFEEEGKVDFHKRDYFIEQKNMLMFGKKLINPQDYKVKWIGIKR